MRGSTCLSKGGCVGCVGEGRVRGRRGSVGELRGVVVVVVVGVCVCVWGGGDGTGPPLPGDRRAQRRFRERQRVGDSGGVLCKRARVGVGVLAAADEEQLGDSSCSQDGCVCVGGGGVLGGN